MDNDEEEASKVTFYTTKIELFFFSTMFTDMFLGKYVLRRYAVLVLTPAL